MGSLERRLRELEISGASQGSPGDGEPASLARTFVGAVLKAISHIRRAPIDSPSWRYDVEKLRDDSPFKVAEYVAALRVLEHEDEAEARHILDELVEARGVEAASLAPLLKLIDLAVHLAGEAGEGQRGGGARWGA